MFRTKKVYTFLEFSGIDKNPFWSYHIFIMGKNKVFGLLFFVVAVALIVVGLLLYKEAITWNKIAGIVICLVGLVFINLK